jgi:hypothetical protein
MLSNHLSDFYQKDIMSLELDTTGLATANRIEGEVIAVTPSSLSTFGCLYLVKGPFFGKNFAISFTPTTPSGASAVPLVLGVDYDFKFELPGFGETPQDKVWGALNIFNQGLSGNITVSYQSLGGNWTFDQAAIKTYLNTQPFNSSFQFMALVSKEPLHLPNNPNAEWPLNSIQSITIAQAQMVSGITLAIAFLRIDGDDDGTSAVVVLDTPLPPNAAREEGGKLATIAASQGASGSGINPPAGGSGILGWLSGSYNVLVGVKTAAESILAKLMGQVAVTQSGNWDVTLKAGDKMVGTFLPAALAEIVDYATTVGYVYICQGIPGSASSQGVWRIQKISLTTGSVQWANGSGNFDQIADNRSSLTYS